jgi:WD40 repeat protein
MATPKPRVASPHRVVASDVNASGLSRAGAGQLVAAGGFGGPGRHQVSLIDTQTGVIQGSFGTESAVVCWYAESSCDGVVAAGFGDLSLRLWTPETNVTRQLATLGGIVASVAWSADGKHLFTGNCGDNTVRLWDVARGTVIAERKTKKSATWFVAMSGDATRAVSGAGDKVLHVWEPMSGLEIASLTGHTGKITGLAFFPDGARVASASQDRSVRLWDLDAQKELFVLRGHAKEVRCVAVAPDGTQLASASSDGTIRLWDAQTGAEECVLSVGATAAAAITYSADGEELFAGCNDAVLRAFPVGR